MISLCSEGNGFYVVRTQFLSACYMKLVYSNIYPTRCNVTQFIYIWKLLYMFRVVTQPIIRSTHNCIYSIWYLSNRYCYLPLAASSSVCAPDDGWSYHPKHVEQFSDINKLCNAASCWIYIGIYLRCTDPWTLNETDASEGKKRNEMWRKRKLKGTQKLKLDLGVLQCYAA